MTRGGLPHSDIPGSKLVCSSPGLFAACHVLHRLLAPRHSPYTLSSLTIKLKTDAHQSFACRLVCDSFFRNTARVCGRKKLPCAEYSVVKDQVGDSAPKLTKSLAAAFAEQSGNVGHLSERHSRSAKRSVPTSVQERRKRPITPPKLFQIALVRRRACARGLTRRRRLQPVLSASAPFGLRRDNFSRTSPSEKLVENTGLEPVTSWLQTRRSPS
jgi:hypothetical protein